MQIARGSNQQIWRSSRKYAFPYPEPPLGPGYRSSASTRLKIEPGTQHEAQEKEACHAGNALIRAFGLITSRLAGIIGW